MNNTQKAEIEDFASDMPVLSRFSDYNITNFF